MELSFSQKPRGKEEIHARLKDLESQRKSHIDYKDYDAAEFTREDQLILTAEFQHVLHDMENHRQSQELQKLRVAFLKMQDDFLSEWSVTWKSFDAESAQRVARLEERQSLDRVRIEEELSIRMEGEKMRPSRELSALRLTEKKLADIHRYDEAREVKRRADLLEQQEHKKWATATKATIDERFVRLEEKQAAELLALEQGIKRDKELLKKRQREEIEKLKQKMRNLERDMRHSHVMELSMAPERNPASRSHHLDTSSTYLGTRMMQRVSSLPSISASRGATR